MKKAQSLILSLKRSAFRCTHNRKAWFRVNRTVAGMLALSFFLCGCGAKETSMEQKLVFLDTGKSVDEDSILLKDYQEALRKLALRFEISEKEVANMTYAISKDISSTGGKVTTLDLLKAVEKVTNSKNGDMLGKGVQNYAHVLATLTVQIKSDRR